MGCDAGAFRGVAWVDVDGWMVGRWTERENNIVARLLLLLTADAMPTERLSYLLLRGWLLMLCDEQLLGFCLLHELRALIGLTLLLAPPVDTECTLVLLWCV